MKCCVITWKWNKHEPLCSRLKFKTYNNKSHWRCCRSAILLSLLLSTHHNPPLTLSPDQELPGYHSFRTQPWFYLWWTSYGLMVCDPIGHITYIVLVQTSNHAQSINQRFVIRAHHFLNPAILISMNSVVSVFTSILKQPILSLPLLSTPNLTTGTVALCPIIFVSLK